jgi:hypothetical protein
MRFFAHHPRAEDPHVGQHRLGHLAAGVAKARRATVPRRDQSHGSAFQAGNGALGQHGAPGLAHGRIRLFIEHPVPPFVAASAVGSGPTLPLWEEAGIVGGVAAHCRDRRSGWSPLCIIRIVGVHGVARALDVQQRVFAGYPDARRGDA